MKNSKKLAFPIALIVALTLLNPQEASHSRFLQEQHTQRVEASLKSLHEQHPDLEPAGIGVPSVAHFDGENSYVNWILFSYTRKYATNELSTVGILGLVW